ncbi:MAG: GDSL-type esterase/lipase family protein [Clostridiales bacterium]|nr:GDSL-type esterase/lipase family protein [Clostridiales bacterium]
MDFFQEYTKMEQAQKIDRYRILNKMVKKGQILFTGSSLMEQFPIQELLVDCDMHQIIYNRGVGGFTTTDMLQNMDVQIFDPEPSCIFINIGTNDIADASRSFEEVLADTLANYEEILKQIKHRLPETKVYMMAYYPVNETDKVPEGEWGKTLFVNRNNRNLPIANAAVKQLAEKYDYHYIDVNDGLTDDRGMLKKEYTIEGVHMYANGYRVVLENMRKYLE